MKQDIQKITANLPADLLNKAMKITGLGITETLREGLKEIERKSAYRQLADLRGKVKVAQTWEELKADRE